jgi:Transposase and inactivated derivatives
MQDLLDTVENSSEHILYALDETYIRLEPTNRKSWSPVGQPPLIERNGSHAGLNIVGATEITKNFDTIADVYSHKQGITSTQIQILLERLIDINKGKRVHVIWDNAGSHTSENMEAFLKMHKKELILHNLPPYSPELNPQENVWSVLKERLHRAKARHSLNDLFDHVCLIYESFNTNADALRKEINARNYYNVN